jgi:uncharacterized protein YndB with AHSA1/START domain
MHSNTSTHEQQGGAMTDGRDLFTSRVIEGPRDRVFAALMDPVRLARWWGPKDFTNVFSEFDPRPGGAWRFVMRGPDGKEYPNESRFIEVLPPERVVFRHLSVPHFEMTITFEDARGGTRVGWRQRFDTADECRRIAHFAVDANEQNLDRLAHEVTGGA